jgi:hypothetical protein
MFQFEVLTKRDWALVAVVVGLMALGTGYIVYRLLIVGH